MTSQPRRFHLQRGTDITGVSGTGRIADGVQWPDGTASVRWTGPRPSTVFWDGGIADAEHIHGHGGHTRIVWDDPEQAQRTTDDAMAELGRTRTELRTALRQGVKGTRAEERIDHLVDQHQAAVKTVLAHRLAEQFRERGNSAMAVADADGGRTTPSDPKYDKAATWYAAADLTDPEAQR